MISILFIMPFGIKNNINFDETYDKISENIKKRNEYKVYRVDKIESTNDIDSKMYKSILAADIVVADISLYNPNVLYELGIRHSFINKTTKIIQKSNSNDGIPFDVSHITIFTYSDDWNSLSNFILKKETEETDSIIRKNIKDLPIRNFDSFKSLFLNWENKYKEFKDKINLAKKTKKYESILEITNEFEIFFGKNFEPLVLEKALVMYKNNEENSEKLLEAKKILEDLRPNFESSLELLGLISSINNRLLKFNLIDKEEVYEFASQLYLSKKTLYTLGIYLMSHVELSIKGYFSKKYVTETIARIKENFHSIIKKDNNENIEYLEDTKILINYILDEVQNPVGKHTTTKNNLDRIKKWKEMKEKND